MQRRGIVVGLRVGQSVGVSVCLSAFFLSNHGSGGHQMWTIHGVHFSENLAVVDTKRAEQDSGVGLSKSSIIILLPGRLIK